MISANILLISANILLISANILLISADILLISADIFLNLGGSLYKSQELIAPSHGVEVRAGATLRVLDTRCFGPSSAASVGTAPDFTGDAHARNPNSILSSRDFAHGCARLFCVCVRARALVRACTNILNYDF